MTGSKDMRLPGSVAEIQASPAGPHIGAFFDLDGTLVAGFTGVILTQEQFLSRQLGIGDLIGMIEGGISHKLGRLEFEGLIRKLITFMMEDPRTISASIDLVFVAKAIERVGDHAKNLAEAIIYIVKGTDVRHNSLDAVESIVR